jgi:hypothetical protein
MSLSSECSTSSRTSKRFSDDEYCSCYCEENVYRLLSKRRAQLFGSTEDYAVFTSGGPVYKQQGGDPGKCAALALHVSSMFSSYYYTVDSTYLPYYPSTFQ